MNFTYLVEILGVIIPIIGGFFATVTFLLKKIINPTISMVKVQEELVETVNEIKKELTTNGGSSIKDTINRIDKRQVIIDKRSKAVFYNCQEIILEVDDQGNFLWANQKFYSLIGAVNISGLDWVSHIDEDERERFLKELKSCSLQNREFKYEANSINSKKMEFLGFPYRDDGKNYGFLIFLKEE